MNKGFLKIALLSAMCASMPFSFYSCKDYDDDIDNLQNQINSVKTSVDALQQKIEDGTVITGVEKTANGILVKTDKGNYEITNGTNGTNGTDGKDGAPGTVWTIDADGFWVKDGVKTDFRAVGTNGTDGKNGTSWTIGEDGYWYMDGKKTDVKAEGTDGTNGTNGTNWTIGEDGYWYKDGEKTNYKAIGTDGTNGTNGQNGKYYVPNADGTFDIYQDGKFVENSGISWAVAEKDAITASYSGNQLILANVTDKDGKPTTVTMSVGTPVGTLAFIPSVLSSVGGYATTDKPFYHLDSYFSEEKYNASTKVFTPQTSWNKSNVVALEYRISPQDAYIPAEATGKFLNRVVTSRAEGDNYTLLNVAGLEIEGANASGVLNVKATYNKTAATAAAGGNDIAAFQLWNGQTPFTTDYIAASSSAVDAVIVNPEETKKANAAVTYYERTKAITGDKAESSAFIQSMVKLSDPANVQMLYNGTLDINSIIDLYSTTKSNFLTNLDFDGISYAISLPGEYLATDAQHTNQQWFVTLSDEGVLSVNSKNLTDGLTPAIGRTPVVRVDAFMLDNAGTSRMVASSYIKVEIVDEIVTPPSQQDKPDLAYPMTDKFYEYHALKAANTVIGSMDWTDVNNKIYGRAGLTSSTFWNYYGGASDEYEVEISVIEKNGNKKVLNPTNNKATANNTFSLTQDGISCEVTLGSNATTTSDIKFMVNNKVKTENTYKDVNGQGAEYTITITIPSDNVKSKGNVVVTQKFYVKEDCTPYEYNPNYYAGTTTVGNETLPYVITKGKQTAAGWKLQMNISEVFKMINGKSIYSYYNTINNVTAINFALRAGQTGVAMTDVTTTTPQTQDVALTAALVGQTKVVVVDYDVTLVNGEKCEFAFAIQFNNPFKSGKLEGLVLDGNAIGSVTVEAEPEVNVVDLANNAIYNWSEEAEALVLSETATGVYKLTDAMMNVKYAFKKNSAYDTFKGQLAPDATFEVDENTGVITYDNLGATLIPSYNLVVEATITVENVSVVVCEIPVLVKGQSK